MAKDSEEVTGIEGEATPKGSDGTSGQPSSAQEYVTVDKFQEVVTLLERLQSDKQSQKDRAVKRVNSRLDEVENNLKALLQNAKNEGLTVDQMLEQVEQEEEREFREKISELSEFVKGGLPQAPKGGSEGKSGVDVSDVLKSLELSLDDPRVKAFAGKQFKSEAEAYREGALLVKTISTNKPTEADAPSFNSRRVSSEQATALKQEYAERSKNLRGQALVNLKMEMRKKGLDVS